MKWLMDLRSHRCAQSNVFCRLVSPSKRWVMNVQPARNIRLLTVHHFHCPSARNINDVHMSVTCRFGPTCFLFNWRHLLLNLRQSGLIRARFLNTLFMKVNIYVDNFRVILINLSKSGYSASESRYLKVKCTSVKNSTVALGQIDLIKLQFQDYSVSSVGFKASTAISFQLTSSGFQIQSRDKLLQIYTTSYLFYYLTRMLYYYVNINHGFFQTPPLSIYYSYPQTHRNRFNKLQRTRDIVHRTPRDIF